jgi:hypothetical protein
LLRQKISIHRRANAGALIRTTLRLPIGLRPL